MRQLFALAIICIYCCCISTAFGQTTYAVKGAVVDTASKTRLDGATITLLNAKDSVLQKFTYSSKGAFSIDNLKPGKLLLLVTYPDFADYTENFELDATHQQKDFGEISMTLKSKLLKDVIIKAKPVAMKFKGDTTEFDAAAYATQKNAKVEDLLKQLPGMRINQSGVILFQGETVEKILIDGEEFFYDDPALITKNVRADMVSKIQVYNDKSAFAKQTGYDDGKKIKTINVVLREDKRNGVFGKADAEEGNDKRYGEQLMANKFSPKEKIAVYGNLSNTGNVGLGGGDNDKYGGGFGGNYDGTGIPKAIDAGAHYDGKWNKDKQTLSSTYKVGSLGVDNASSSISQNSLPDGFNRTLGSGKSHNYSFSQDLYTEFRSQIDSSSNIFVSINGSTRHGDNQSQGSTSTFRGDGSLQNSNDSHNSGSSDNKGFNGYATYYRNLKKKGRSFSVSASTSNYLTSSNRYFSSNLKYYNARGLIDSTQNTDQYKPSTSIYHSGAIYFNYTEPVSKELLASVGASLTGNNSNSNQRSFNKSASGLYDSPDLLYSNDYTNRNVHNSYYINLGYRHDKLSVNTNISMTHTNETQTNNIIDSALKRKFIEWSSSAYVNYDLGKSEHLTFDYSGNTRQPGIFEIQPLRQNSDPLNITIGNPKLTPGFNNEFKLRYYLYRPTYDSGINMWAGYSNQINAIITNRSTDSAGKNVYQYANLRGHQPNSWYFHFNTYNHYTKLDFLLYPGININGNTSYNYVNDQLSKNKSVTYSPDVTLQKNATNYGYGFEVSYTYTTNAANLQNTANNTRGYDASFNFNTKLPFNFFIGSDGNYQFRGANQVFTQNFSRFLLKAYFGKKFLKEENLKLTITGNDLLNQNTGYNRSGDSNSFSESYNEVIRRFFMFSVTWDFTRFKKTAEPQTPNQ